MAGDCIEEFFNNTFLVLFIVNEKVVCSSISSIVKI